MGISKKEVTNSLPVIHKQTLLTKSSRPGWLFTHGLRRQQKRLLLVTVIQSKVLVKLFWWTHQHNLCICEVCNI